MRNVYVVGAHIPNGGTFIAYHLGLILSKHIDARTIAVRVGNEDPESSVFEYPQKISIVGIDEFKEVATPRDLLIMNPSFSELWLGPSFRGYKLMYVQGFNTFNMIDGWFDSYVSVSEYVRGFLQYVYGINSPVIPPFVDLIAPGPWEDRLQSRVLVVTKGSSTQQAIIFEHIKQKIARNRPDIGFDFVPERMSHKAFLAFLTGYRYVLSLSCAEGFGLVPLESMGLGAAVVAFDAGGGRSYMVDQQNCLCTSYPNVEQLADRLLYVLNNSDEALRISGNGIEQAKLFTYERFYESWMNYFRTNLRAK
jgi:hypothetical protein